MTAVSGGVNKALPVEASGAGHWKRSQLRLVRLRAVGTLPPDDALRQPCQGAGQFVSDVLGKVLDSCSKCHHHEAVARRVIHPCLHVLWQHRDRQSKTHFLSLHLLSGDVITAALQYVRSEQNIEHNWTERNKKNVTAHTHTHARAHTHTTTIV